MANCEWINPATEDLIKKETGLTCGYLGPVGIKLKVYADQEIPLILNGITGANKVNTHLTGVQFDRDLIIQNDVLQYAQIFY